MPMPERPYTYEEVKAAADTAVRIMGPGYVYRSRVIGKCFYSTAEEKAYVPDVTIYSSLMSWFEEVNLGSAQCIIGFVSRILDFPLKTSGSANIALYQDVVTSKARYFLAHLQVKQDGGVAWGTAVETAARDTARVFHTFDVSVQDV